MMKKGMLEINVYDEKGNVTKTSKAQAFDLEFGTIRKLMRLVNIRETKSTYDLLCNVNDSWDEITRILSLCFRDMEDSDWEHIKIKELLPVLMDIVKMTVQEIMKGQDDEKN